MHVVLRRWIPASESWNEWAKKAVEHEAAVLQGLPPNGVPGPSVIAVTDGVDCGGVPAVLMTRAPGRMLLAPARQREWLAQIAGVLPSIHAARIDVPAWQSWIDVEALAVPPWASARDVWRVAIDAVREGGDATTCFIHRDYQHFNLLWSRQRLTAVVDWVNASSGPPDIDVGHCRLNLAVLFSADAAEDFRRIYEAEAGRAVDPRWDIHALLSYSQEWKGFIPFQVGNRAPVEIAGMDRRVEETLAAAVARL